MSGFGGQMKEYRQISIDRFDKSNLKSTVYFLSHCHRDHMVGLDQPNFLRCLKSRDDVFLYCSAVTKLLLLSEDVFKPLSAYTRVLKIGVATMVTLPDPQSEDQEYKSVTVTALPAGHCPGSVMFLFEGKEGRALYTGDFRWERNYATTLPALCVNGHVKEIDSMYVDTTFCIPEAFNIPSRDDCLSATALLVVAWLRQSPRHYVHVSSRTKYGHEPLLAHLAKEAETQVHTSKQKAELYEQISELRGVFTADPSARIHACYWQGERDGESPLPCGYCPPKGSNSESLEVLVIRPSTMWFTAEPSRLQELVVSPASGRGLHRACYSFHSSYSELRDLVSLLRPRRVYPNVLPASDLEWGQVKERLKKFLTYRHKYHMSPAGDPVTAKPLGLLKRKRAESFNNLTDSKGLVFDSPEKARQPKQESSEDLQLSSQKSQASNIISPAKSETHSSYPGSVSEEDMFADSFEGETTPAEEQGGNGGGGEEEVTGPKGSQSLRSYVSGDEDVPEEDRVSSPRFRHLTSRDDQEVDLDADFHPDDGDDAEESGIVDDTGVSCHKKFRFGTEPELETAATAKSSPREAGELAHTDRTDDVSMGNLDQKELSGCSAETSEEVTGKVRDEKLHPTICPEESRDGLAEKAGNSEDCVYDSDLDLRSDADEAADHLCEQKGQKTFEQADKKAELESEKEDGESESCSVENSNRGDFGVENVEKNDSQGGDELELEGAKGNPISCDQNAAKSSSEHCDLNVAKGNSQGCDLNMDNSEKSKTNADCKFESEILSDESDDSSPQGGGERELKEDPRADRERPQPKQQTGQRKGSAESKNTVTAAQTQGSRSRAAGATGKNQETNLISSDSDSDADCKITRSFIRQRQSHPRQMQQQRTVTTPQGFQVHGRRSPAQRSPVWHRVSVDSGTIHKLSFRSSPNSKGGNCRVSGAGFNGRKSGAASISGEAAGATGSIDLASEDEEEETSGDPRTKKKEAASLLSDKRDQTETTKVTSLRRGSLAADDADVEDNDEEDGNADGEKSKTSALSTHRNGLSNRDRSSQQFCLDVIVIEDNENSSPPAGKPKPQEQGGLQGRRGSDASGPLTSAASRGQQGPTPHTDRSSATERGVTAQGRSHSPPSARSPAKETVATEAGQTLWAQTDGSPDKAAASAAKAGQMLLEQYGFSPAKQGDRSHQAASPAKASLKQKHEAGGTPKRQTHKPSTGSTSTPTKCCSRKEEGRGENNSRELNQTADERGKRSAESEGREEEAADSEDSDATVPPDCPDFSPPTTSSPVAVHSSESDSDGDADCRITRSFIRSPQRGGQPSHSHCSHYSQVDRHPHPGQHHQMGHHSHSGQTAGSSCQSRSCSHSHRPQFLQGAAFRPQPQSATHQRAAARPVHPVCATATSQSKKTKQSSVIDLTEEDE